MTKAILEAEIEDLNIDNYTKDEVIVVCGSFFIMKEIRESLGYFDEVDLFDLNETTSNLKFEK